MPSTSKFMFNDPILIDLSFEINHEYDLGELDKAALSINFARAITKYARKNEAVVELTLTINIDKNKIKDITAPFWMMVKYGAKFYWETGTDEKQVQSFLDVNAPTLLLSYIRPLVSQITDASPLPKYNIPFLNLTDWSDEQSSASND